MRLQPAARGWQVHASPARCTPPSRSVPRANLSSVAAQSAGTSGYEVQGHRPTSPKAWEIISTTLRKEKLKMISPEELAAAQKRGATVIDIRPRNEPASADGFVPGALRIEFFRLIEEWGPEKIARRALFLFFGIANGTEWNPDFVSEVEAAVPTKSATLVIYCNIGGSLESTGPSEFGRQSRSLNAAYELRQAGYANVQVLRGGYNAWLKAEQPVEVAE